MGGGGGGGALPDFFFFFSCSADHERDWPPCKVVFSGLVTNALNVRNNNNNNISFSHFPLLPISNVTVVHQCCLTPTEMKNMSSRKHLSPSTLHFSPIYTSSVYYIIYLFCETLHY